MKLSPHRWANDISIILRTVHGANRFPVDVKNVAKEISNQKFPEDPIIKTKGDDLPGFEGALAPAPKGKTGWAIIYNDSLGSSGRINFTLAHEFGHYLLHRQRFPNGFQCSTDDMARWDSEYNKVEQEANTFAANLLMPLDDFRYHISGSYKPNLDELGACAKRYDVSLMAATLRWLQYTRRRALLVVSREGFILWARSSEPAFKTGLYFKTNNVPPVEVPDLSLAGKGKDVAGQAAHADHDSSIWLQEPCQEHVLFSEQYDFAISLLHFANDASPRWSDFSTETDVYDFMRMRSSG